MEETSDDEVITDDKVESFLMILKRLQLGLILNNKAEEVNIEEIVQDITTENQIDNDSTITKVNQGNEDTNIIEKKYSDLEEEYVKVLKQREDSEDKYHENIEGLRQKFMDLQTLYKEKVTEVSNLETRLEESSLELASFKDKLRNIEVDLRFSQQISGEAVKITELLKKVRGNPGPGLLGPAPSPPAIGTSLKSSCSWSGPSHMVPRSVNGRYQMNRRM